MEEKKLINHIVVSRKNQQQIFASLSKNDFKKIISNLEDQNQKLRKISLLLISQLLHNNQPLKLKFCQIMGIPTLPGRIALNTKLCPSSSRTKNTITLDMTKNIREVYTLLKQPLLESKISSKVDQKSGLFWFINFEHRSQGSLQLEHVNSQNSPSITEILDPVDSMVGFVLGEKAHRTQSSPVQGRRKSEYEGTKMINNYFKATGTKAPYKPEGYRGDLNQSLNMTPGYSTDRDMGYFVKGVGKNEQNQSFNRSMQNGPALQPRNNQETKYGGIKLISTATTVAKGREGGKYFEESGLFQGSSSTTHKAGLNNPAIFGKVVGRVERGYQTLREKKLVQKYPGE